MFRLICRLRSGDSHGGYSGLDSWMGSLCTVGHGACLIVDIINFGATASGPVGPVWAGPIFREKVGAFVPVVRDCRLASRSRTFSHAWLLVGVAAQRSSHAAIRYSSKAGGHMHQLLPRLLLLKYASAEYEKSRSC